MSRTPIADMVEKMLAAALVGRLSADFIVLAVRTAEVAAQHPIDIIAEKRRSRDRDYSQDRRRKSADGQNAPSSSLSSSSSLLKREEEEEKKKETKTPERPRPVPLPASWEPSPVHFTEGAALGFSHAEILDQAQDMKIWAGANAHRSVARKSSWNLTFSGWMRRTRKTFVGKQRAKPATDGLERSAGQNFDIPPWERVGKSQEQYFADLKKANGHEH
jgi:hypothetical protein